jgi:hypothetical protein
MAGVINYVPNSHILLVKIANFFLELLPLGQFRSQLSKGVVNLFISRTLDFGSLSSPIQGGTPNRHATC